MVCGCGGGEEGVGGRAGVASPLDVRNQPRCTVHPSRPSGWSPRYSICNQSAINLQSICNQHPGRSPWHSCSLSLAMRREASRQRSCEPPSRPTAAWGVMPHLVQAAGHVGPNGQASRATGPQGKALECGVVVEQSWGCSQHAGKVQLGLQVGVQISCRSGDRDQVQR